MSSSDRKLANAVGGISARACDNCVRTRAQWYCAADDAFLCQSCDSSVHSGNPLFRRHERVPLKTGSIRSNFDDEFGPGPSWHQGITKKARTQRQKKHTGRCYDDEPASGVSNPPHLVPEICSEESGHQETDEQLLGRVPVLDPVVAELHASATAKDNTQTDAEIALAFGYLPSPVLDEFSQEIDLADFESLLGKEIEDEWFDMEGLGLADCDVKEIESGKCCLRNERAVKIEDAKEEFIHIGRETSELNWCYKNVEEDTKALPEELKVMSKYEDSDIEVSKNIFLRLDYKGVMSAWDDQKFPWTTGERPDLNPSTDECWPYCLGTCGAIHENEDMGGREARVMRYREKRRTRLFSKKIRYQVRKLNAEKRPRIKGRFVKRDLTFCNE